MLVKNYKKCAIVNAFKNNGNLVQISEDFFEPFSSEFICASTIHEHCRSATDIIEVAVLRGKVSSKRDIEYILHTYDGGAVVQCHEFSYGKLKNIIIGLQNIEMITELDEGALAETGWELIYEQQYDGWTLDKVIEPLKGVSYKMSPWMHSFLSQLNKKFNYYIDREGETDDNLPLLTRLVMVFGWVEVRRVLDAYPQVDNSPLVNKTWATGHPIIYISDEINNPEELLAVHSKYFERVVKFDNVIFKAVGL